jgi:DNA-binding XRE family transcriptional regulator
MDKMKPAFNITPAQCRMARAALKMGVRELAALAQVSTNTITRFEMDEPLRLKTQDAIKLALEAGGVVFIDPDADGGGGVRFAMWYSPQFAEAMKSGLSPLRLVYVSERIVRLESTTPSARVIIDMDRMVFNRRMGHIALNDRILETQIQINMAAFAAIIARMYLDKKGGFAAPVGTKIIDIQLGEEELKDVALHVRLYDDLTVDIGDPPVDYQ